MAATVIADITATPTQVALDMNVSSATQIASTVEIILDALNVIKGSMSLLLLLELHQEVFAVLALVTVEFAKTTFCARLAIMDIHLVMDSVMKTSQMTMTTTITILHSPALFYILA
jgi:hypothetical protein